MTQYLPTYCDACQRAAAIERTGGNFTCSFCAGPNRVLPGAAYGVADLPLFVELETIVEAAKLTSIEASLVVDELERCSSNVEGWRQTLERLSPRLPGLEAFAEVVLDHPTHLQRSMGILHCVSSARKRRSSKP